MNRVFKYAIWKLKGVKVYALVGRSGTGKSFCSQLVANKYHIPLIIDDGILIKGDKIIAGMSAKQEQNFLTAVKRALFVDPVHQQEVVQALQKERYHKILIIGTSEKMVAKIALRLNLPEPDKVIHIEEIASPEDIDTAMRIRYAEGKHVIPVSPLQITRSYPSIVYDSIKIGLKKRFPLLFFRTKQKAVENTLVRPEFSKLEKNSISEAALTQMVGHCLGEYDSTIKVEKVTFKNVNEGFDIDITLRTPQKIEDSVLPELREYITDSLEKYGGIFVSNATIHIKNWDEDR